MKKIINQPAQLVHEMCRGLVYAHSELAFQERYKVVSKKTLDPRKVTLISGGGSGHEPAHAGFIGEGLLDAAVCGDVFASPSQIQVYKGIKQTASERGTLLIIKNYSGDIMNFKNAAEMAQEEGLEVDFVKVDDDIAVNDSLYTVGRRGVAGTIFVHKVVGAAAAAGLSLAEVKQLGDRTAQAVRSLGFALTSCTVPAKGTPTFHLADDEMEYGVGIHGEPGRSREKTLPATEIARRMVDQILETLPKHTKELAVLVNGFGATPLMELYVLNEAVIKILLQKGYHIVLNPVGNFMTSIDMAGASLSILEVDKTIKPYLLASCSSPALTLAKAPTVLRQEDSGCHANAEHQSLALDYPSDAVLKGDTITYANITFLIDRMTNVILEQEVPFCELDAHAGDGDFGMSIAKGFRELRKHFSESAAEHDGDIGALLLASSEIIMEHCGGASGPIWGSAFRAAGLWGAGKAALTTNDFAGLLSAAVKGIQRTGERSFGRGADIGDKTLMDALIPATNAWHQAAQNGTPIRDAFHLAAKAAVDGAEATKEIVARMGRAGTVGERSLGYPDAGAHALGVIFTDLANALE